MPPKKKGNYLCKSKVECLACGSQVLSENEKLHIKNRHNGDLTVKFRIVNDAKQPKLDFHFKKDETCGNSSDIIVNDNNFEEKSEGDSCYQSTESTSEVVNIVQDERIEDDVFKESIEYDEHSDSDASEKLDVDVEEQSQPIIGDAPNQPKLTEYDPKVYGKQKRDFQSDWYIKHPWIDFNISRSEVSCFACQKFGNDASFKFDNWKKPERLKKHALSKTHLLAMTKWSDSKIAKKKHQNILTQLQAQHAAEVRDNRNYLRELIKTVATMGKQNISFRGHTENRKNLSSLSDINRGNFLEILSLRSNDSAFLKERLDRQLPNKGYGQWTSGKVQNELIELVSDFTIKKIIGEIQSDASRENYIGIISDETSDISRHEQVSLVVTYIDQQGQKRESFLKFLKTDQTDGESLFHLLSNSISDLGLDLKKVVGLGFDGASNMCGVNKGVATRFKEVSPHAIYVHCYGHLLNLATKDCLSGVTLLRNTLGVAQSLYNFIEASPKRHAMFVNVDSEALGSEGRFVRTLKSLSVTRWTADAEAIKGIDEEFDRIVLCLQNIIDEPNCDSKVSSDARSLLRAVLDHEFIFGLSILKIILPHTSKLSSFVQGTKIDVHKVRLNADLTIKTLETCRGEDSFDLLWARTDLRCKQIKEFIILHDIDVDFVDVSLPRSRRPSKRRQGLVGELAGGDVEFTDVKVYSRITHFYPAMDLIITELRNRFAENDHNVLLSLSSMISDKVPSDADFEQVSEMYSLDVDLLKSDHQLLSHFKVSKLTMGLVIL